MSKSPFTFSARLWGTLTAVFAVWVVAAWLLTGAYQTFRSNAVLNERSAKVEHLAQGLADDIQRDLARLHDIPKMVANDHAVKSTLPRWENLLHRAPSAVEQRKRIWTTDATLRQLNQDLSLFNDSLRSSVIFIMNAAGDCLASSNADMADSFVGSNYASRDYFKDAMIGKKARRQDEQHPGAVLQRTYRTWGAHRRRGGRQDQFACTASLGESSWRLHQRRARRDHSGA